MSPPAWAWPRTPPGAPTADRDPGRGERSPRGSTRAFVALLASGLERVSQCARRLGDGGVGGDDVGQAVAGASLVELIHGCVEAFPEVLGAAAPGPGP